MTPDRHRTPSLRLTPERVAAERDWVLERSAVVVPLANEVRARLAAAFETDVDPIAVEQYERAIDETFADGDRAVNVAALVALLRGLDVDDDYPGFVVDEWLGRELAATIAGPQPLRLLAEATFHVADVHYHGPESLDTDLAGDRAEEAARATDAAGTADDAAIDDGEASSDGTANRDDGTADDGHAPTDAAGCDDLDAALAAGVQTRLPGWDWTAEESPFAVRPDR